MPRFARGATPWILVPLLVAVACVAAGLTVPALFLLALAAVLPFVVFLFFLQFFRDPERSVAGGVVSPADGKVVRIDQVDDPVLGTVDRLAIFMSPKDVHVNRFPLDGTVLSVTHIPGGFVPAFKKESDRNERVETLLDTDLGRVKMIQIAGAVARRIVPYISGGEQAVKGVRMGLIRLGSRCDLLVPPGSVAWTVQVGEQVYGAKTSLGQPVAKRAAARANATTPATAKAAGKGAAATAKAPAKAEPKPTAAGGNGKGEKGARR